MSTEKHADPFEIASSFLKINQAWTKNLPDFMDKIAELTDGLVNKSMKELEKTVSDGGFSKKKDRDGKALLLDFVKQSAKSARQTHTMFGQWLNQMVENAPDVDEENKNRSKFWANQIISTLAPGNYFWTNPGAVRRFLDSDGESLKDGIANWTEDLERGDNLIKLADGSVFKLGENIAVSPGQVVFRNELMELIQYAPATETVFAVPIVLIQPWINKYYIFDLSPANSFVKFLTNRGFTVFITSWKNPGKNLRHIGFDDYVFKGVQTAVETARDICGTDHVHAAGYCIGGTALAAYMAWMNTEHKSDETAPVADWSLFSTLLDFSEAGDLGLLISEQSVDSLEELTQSDGYLDSKYLGLTFRLLNSDGLIWRYHINNYLMGQPPPKSDMLYWNGDSTRLPEAMCSFYLREFYVNNNFAKDGIMVGGRRVRPGNIRQPAYIVGAKQDHISPWKGTYKTCGMVKCPVRYALSSEGHITGIVNPPTARSKKKIWVGTAGNGLSPDAWVDTQEEVRGSWWADWIEWMRARSLPEGPPPDMGGASYPVLGPAPGSYVFEK